MPLKTLHLVNAWHASSGGIATFYRALMDAANETGQELRLVVPYESSGVEAVGPHCRIYYVQSGRAPWYQGYRMLYPQRYLPRGSEIQRILMDERPDLVEEIGRAHV